MFQTSKQIKSGCANKTAVNAPYSRRFATLSDAQPARQHLDGGVFSIVLMKLSLCFRVLVAGNPYLKSNRRAAAGVFSSIRFFVMKPFFSRLAACFLLLAFSPVARAAIDPASVKEIAAMLQPHAAGFGRPITDRAAWDEALANHPELTNIIALAAGDAKKPLPTQPDSLFLEFSRDGNRSHWQDVASSRRSRIEVFTLAECVENKGRFIEPLENTIAAICAERTWVLPAHDGKLQNFYGKSIDIELDSSYLAAELATVNYLLGDRLSPDTRALIHENLERRIFGPYRDAMNGNRPEFWWMHGGNNWDAVCLCGVTGAALATFDSPEERAWYIAAAEKYIGSYLDGGFTPDGYCVEGLGYWNYGFGHFALLSENIREATGGQIDLLARPRAAQPALFGLRSEIFDGVHTSIADCNPSNAPSPSLMDYLNHRFAFGLPPWHAAKINDTLYSEIEMLFRPADLPVISVEKSFADQTWRAWFSDSGVLICRPGPGAPTPFAVAIKGGNNGVNHGHADVGSFSVVVGSNMVICDPGGEVYTARTFGPHRFESEVLNSFGHAVPLIAGKLQRTGRQARAEVLETNFMNEADSIVFDLRSAYPVEGLQKLERSFTYQRGASPSLTVRDEVAFAAPESFESTLITWGEVTRLGENEFEISDRGSAVKVEVDTQGRSFHLNEVKINEDTENHRIPIHVGIVLDDKISAGTVTLKISPVTNN